ncbi:hypothetical protein [Seonamhaeicola marinus]|uniref:Uncharacterized protein n=1 Tax=Seonamhaeicola marinus TaxID=1912246 RepID=A0A5D0HVR1_9FLAO|nr:hypothetical protein [Seonamhaeicola marinus]TYA74207.1 hypothetical protein FUA24_12795 [Seonamhaeicola marinus]
MKHLLSIAFIAITSFMCNANNYYEHCNTPEKKDINEIPKHVEKWLKSELANTSTTVLNSFETPAFFTKRNAKIIGYIKGYDQNLGAKTGIFYYRNQLTRENKPKVLEIHKDGRFELELPLAYPTQNYIVIENQGINFYLEPGQNLSVILNWEDLKAKRTTRVLKNVTYQGPLKQINSDLLHYQLDYPSGGFQKKEATMQPKAFKAYMLNFKTNALNKIKAYEESKAIDKKTSELLKNEIILETYHFLFDYYFHRHWGARQRKKNNIDDTLPEDYYDFIKDLPLHKQSILVNHNFASFINRLEYAEPLQAPSKNQRIETGIATDDFLKYLESKNVTVSLKEKELYTKYQKELSNWTAQNGLKNPELPKDLMNGISAFIKKHESFRKDYLEMRKERMENLKKEKFIKELKQQDSIAAGLGIKNNLIYEIIKSRKLYFYLEYSKTPKEKEWYWTALKKGITSPHVIKVGDVLFNEKVSEPETYILPKNEHGTTIFKNLIAPYKGKLIVVQFWHPHSYYRGKNLEDIKKRRNKFKNNKDIVFLNITNSARSSLEMYESSVKNNGFTNSVRIPQDDYNYLRQLFKFNASVHDVLVKQDGETVYNKFKAWDLEYFLYNKFNILPAE